MRSFRAASSTLSLSWMSMARLTFPSRLDLNSPEGSCNAAPSRTLAGVIPRQSPSSLILCRSMQRQIPQGLAFSCTPLTSSSFTLNPASPANVAAARSGARRRGLQAAPEEVREPPEHARGCRPAPGLRAIAHRQVRDERRGEGDGEAGVGPLLEPHRHRRQHQHHAEELRPRELHPEVGGKAEVGERLRHLRQAQLRVGGEAHLQAEERCDDPIDDGLSFEGGPSGDGGRLLQGRFHGVLPFTPQRFGALGGQPGVSTPNCFAYSVFNRCQPPNFMASAPTMNPIGSPARSRSRTSKQMCQPAAPHEMKRRSMLCHSVRRVPPPKASSVHRILLLPQLYSSNLGASARVTLVSETCGVGVPTVESFTGPTAARFRSASNGAHWDRCAGSVSACQTTAGGCRSSRTRTSVHVSPSFCTWAPLARPGVYFSRSVISFSSSSFSLVLIAPCGRGGVRAHRGERTKTDGTEPTRHPPREVVQVSVGRDDAVRPRWIPRNRPLSALAGALTRSAAACEAAALSRQPTVVRRPEGSRSRGGSAPQ